MGRIHDSTINTDTAAPQRARAGATFRVANGWLPFCVLVLAIKLLLLWLEPTPRLYMHKNYADDVSVVNGGWAAPIIGWANYEILYKQQRAALQQVRLDRSNTYVKVNGATAWACYQWEFSAVVNGTPSAARGQTTYVLVKKDNHWLIAHDHTSLLQGLQQPAPNAPPAGMAAPAKPGS